MIYIVYVTSMRFSDLNNFFKQNIRWDILLRFFVLVYSADYEASHLIIFISLSLEICRSIFRTSGYVFRVQIVVLQHIVPYRMSTKQLKC